MNEVTGPAPIRGVLLDSGDTLVRPLGGAWFPGHRFRELVAEASLDAVSDEALTAALALGYQYLEANNTLATEEEERAQFVEYNRIILAELGVAASAELLEALARAMVDDCNFELFPDVVPAIEALRRRGIRLGVISNAWPSLDRKYRQLGVRGHFGAFVVSALLGCSKPDARMYRRGLEELDLPAESVLFVDDWPGHVHAAIALGMRGAVMDRTGVADAEGLTRLGSMADLIDLLDRSDQPSLHLR